MILGVRGRSGVGVYRRSKVCLGASFCRLGASWGGLGAVLWRSWGGLLASWSGLGASWGGLVAVLGHLGADGSNFEGIWGVRLCESRWPEVSSV